MSTIEELEKRISNLESQVIVGNSRLMTGGSLSFAPGPGGELIFRHPDGHEAVFDWASNSFKPRDVRGGNLLLGSPVLKWSKRLGENKSFFAYKMDDGTFCAEVWPLKFPNGIQKPLTVVSGSTLQEIDDQLEKLYPPPVMAPPGWEP